MGRKSKDKIISNRGRNTHTLSRIDKRGRRICIERNNEGR